MRREEIIQKFESLKLWSRHGERAPHKPLLVLYAIRRLLRERIRLIPYTDIEVDLELLLEQFAPRRSNQRVLYPFWLLRNDEVWEVTHADKIGLTASKDALVTDLRRYGVSGGFTQEIFGELQSDSGLALEIVQRLLYKHFPPTIHEDILREAGFEIPLQPAVIGFPTPIPPRRRRDPNFRPQILRLYEYKCAVCSFDAQLRSAPIALDAAHIKWHTHNGPDDAVNGFALCSLHHKLFDRGAFTLSDARELLVSRDVQGSVGLKEWLINFHGKQINLPQRRADYPAVKFIRWHVGAVFKGDYREL